MTKKPKTSPKGAKLTISLGDRHLEMFDKLRGERGASEQLRVLIEEEYYRRLGAKI